MGRPSPAPLLLHSASPAQALPPSELAGADRATPAVGPSDSPQPPSLGASRSHIEDPDAEPRSANFFHAAGEPLKHRHGPWLEDGVRQPCAIAKPFFVCSAAARREESSRASPAAADSSPRGTTFARDQDDDAPSTMTPSCTSLHRTHRRDELHLFCLFRLPFLLSSASFRALHHLSAAGVRRRFDGPEAPCWSQAAAITRTTNHGVKLELRHRSSSASRLPSSLLEPAAVRSIPATPDHLPHR
jgi:hypothetical protein